MAVSDTINSIKTHLGEAYASLEEKGATIPENKNIENLSESILSIEGGGEIDWNEYFATTIKSGSSYNSGIGRSIKKVPPIKAGTDMTKAFYECSNLLDISQLDLTQTTKLDSCFYNCLSLTGDITLNVPNAMSLGLTFSGCNQIKNVILNTSDKLTILGNVFNQCSNLETVKFTNTQNVTSMASLFRLCTKLKSFEGLDTRNATTLDSAFYSCPFPTLVQLDTNNVENMSNMFRLAKIITIPELNAGKVINMNSMFYSESYLENFGGLKDIGKAFTQKTTGNPNYALDLISCTKLTHESLMNVINNLYDLNLTYNVAGGGTLYTQKLALGSTNLAKLTEEEIAIATAKGWTVS